MPTPTSQSLLRNIKFTPSTISLVLLWLIAAAGSMISLLPRLNGFTVAVGLSSFAFIMGECRRDIETEGADELRLTPR